MGMYINETAVMCVTPHIQGKPEDYARETVQVTVAMNGQDFNDIYSDAYVTFVGTGASWLHIKILLFMKPEEPGPLRAGIRRPLKCRACETNPQCPMPNAQ